MKLDVDWSVSRGMCRFNFVVCILDEVCCIVDGVVVNASALLLLLHDRHDTAVHIVAIDRFILAFIN